MMAARTRVFVRTAMPVLRTAMPVLKTRRRRAQAQARTRQRSSRRRRQLVRPPSPPRLALVVAPLVAIAIAAPAQADAPRASLPAVERRVMCVTCKIPLMVAQSPQADRERAFIRGLIAEGDTQAQIERALVAQYGPAALGLPAAHGFDLSAYLVPLAALLGLLAVLALLLPRWRRQARARPAAAPPAHTDGASGLTAAERARLDADLAQFER
jgi:cytochrome c-type biogenesis protein CcmH